MLRLTIDSLDSELEKAWLKANKDQLGFKKLIPFGVLQAGGVDQYARGHNIKANLFFNYRGPFRFTIENILPLKKSSFKSTGKRKVIKKVKVSKKKPNKRSVRRKKPH